MAKSSKSWKEKKELKRLKKQEKALKEKKKLEQKEKDKETEDEEIVEQEEDTRTKPVSTISIAVPGSILENAQSQELRTYLAGQIARAACIYNVDEIVVFDDNNSKNLNTARVSQLETSDGIKTARPCCIQFARILQYLECPQYLRKFFFPIHNDLKFTGLLNPLDSQHHLRQQSEFIYREGIVTNKPHSKGSFVNVGLLNDILVDKQLTQGLRVTVKLPKDSDLRSRKLRGKVVSPSEPRQATGIYWGYNVRIANSISQVFSQSPYEDGYDVSIGTSDKGENVQEVESKSLKFKHLLIVFGGLYGLESAVENDDVLTADDPSLLFDHYFNVAPNQGSRTIRTEEAVLITLAALSEKLEPTDKPREFLFKDVIPQSDDTGMRTFEPPVRKEKKKRKHQQSGSEDESEKRVKSDTENNEIEMDLSRFD